jgi:hypothetical protein
MTVGELIKELQKYNPDKIVLVTAYEEGYDELEKAIEVKVSHNPSLKYWVGEYNDYPSDENLITRSISSGEVFVQKSQLGGGSPMIRGFSANRLLYSIDGVRMNTAIFRSGNLQQVILQKLNL